MAVSRHLGFYRTANSAIRSDDPENPNLEPNMEWIGCTVCEIFAFILYTVTLKLYTTESEQILSMIDNIC